MKPMKPTKATLGLVACMLGLILSGSALAWGRHGPHVRFGVVVGGPVWWGPGYYQPYYYPPYYYSPPPSPPPVYIEQGAAQPAPAAAQPGYWYYCAGANGYYPYVKDCPGGWQRVSPQPPPG